MPLENVEKIEIKQSWFQKTKNFVKSKFALASVASGSLIVGTVGHADGEITVPDFIGPVKSAFTSIASDLGGFFLVILGITVAIAVFAISRGGIKKGSSS